MRLVIPNVLPSEKVIEEVAGLSGGKVLLAFSCGKDSIAAWIALRRAGVKVFPYFYYVCPDLEFVNTSLAYYEDFFGERILRMPAPGLYRQWRRCTHQPPERLPAILGSSLPSFGNLELMQAVKIAHKLPAITYTALGVRAADSVNRRTNFVRAGAVNRREFKFYPVWDWTRGAIKAELFKAKVKLPIDYWIFGRTFDGLDYRFIGPMKKHFPSDYERLREFYPLIDAELKRAEMAGMTEHL